MYYQYHCACCDKVVEAGQKNVMPVAHIIFAALMVLDFMSGGLSGYCNRVQGNACLYPVTAAGSASSVVFI